jgi:hypothetical protein
MNILRKYRSAAAAFGPLNACLYAAHRALNWWGGAVHRYYFVAQPVPPSPVLPPQRGRSIVVRPVATDDPVLSAMPLDPAVIRFRAAQRAICFGAFKGDDLIGCLWVCLGPFDEDEVRARFVPSPSGQASWDFDVYLLPEHRGGLGFARLWDGANQFLRERGVQWSISRISAFNPTSLSTHGRLGARRIGSAVFVRIARWQFSLASLPPYIHISPNMAKAPAFSLWAPVVIDR